MSYTPNFFVFYKNGKKSYIELTEKRARREYTCETCGYEGREVFEEFQSRFKDGKIETHFYVCPACVNQREKVRYLVKKQKYCTRW